MLYRADRSGLGVMALRGSPMGPSPKGLLDILESDEDISRLKAMGYTRLVLASESPVFYATQAANPGSNRKRIMYPDHLPPRTDTWRTLFRSEDLLILEIP
jgi:hypothetical protein